MTSESRKDLIAGARVYGEPDAGVVLNVHGDLEYLDWWENHAIGVALRSTFTDAGYQFVVVVCENDYNGYDEALAVLDQISQTPIVLTAECIGAATAMRLLKARPERFSIAGFFHPGIYKEHTCRYCQVRWLYEPEDFSNVETPIHIWHCVDDDVCLLAGSEQLDVRHKVLHRVGGTHKTPPTPFALEFATLLRDGQREG